jgi:hypothetical protein
MSASSGLATPPAGVPRVLPLPPTLRRFVASPLLDQCLEPHLDEGQDVPIDDAPGRARGLQSGTPEECRVRNSSD